MVDNALRAAMVNSAIATDNSFRAKSSSLKGLFESIDPFNAALTRPELKGVQAELDRITPEKAKKYQTTIKLLVNAEKRLCYTGIVDYRVETRNPRGQNSFDASWARYYSAGFYVKTKIFYIVAPSIHEIGFVQHCTGKSDVSTFNDGSQMYGYSNYPYPIGDSSGGTSPPFYHKAVSNGMVDPAWKHMKSSPKSITLEMSDEFNNNAHPKQAFTAPGVYQPGVFIVKIRRDQSFTNWVMRRRVSGSAPHLLKEVTFRIKVEVDYKIKNNVISQTSFSTRCQIQSATTPPANAVRPMITAQTLNGIETWYYRPHNGAGINTGKSY